MALELAAAVVRDPAFQLAMAVLAGGEFLHSRATQLAARVLEATPPVAEVADVLPGRGAR